MNGARACLVNPHLLNPDPCGGSFHPCGESFRPCGGSFHPWESSFSHLKATHQHAQGFTPGSSGENLAKFWLKSSSPSKLLNSPQHPAPLLGNGSVTPTSGHLSHVVCEHVCLPQEEYICHKSISSIMTMLMQTCVLPENH